MEQKIKDVLRQYHVSDNLIETVDKLNFHIENIDSYVGWDLYTYDTTYSSNTIWFGFHASIMERFEDNGAYDIIYNNHFGKQISIYMRDYKDYNRLNIEQRILEHKNYGGFTCIKCQQEKRNMIYSVNNRNLYGVCSDCHIPQEHKEDTTNYTDDYKQFLIQHKTMWNNLLKALEV